MDLVLGQVLEERRLSVVEEVSSGGEDPNGPSADSGVVRAKPILAMMHSLTSSSSSDGHDTVVIAESTMPGNVHVSCSVREQCKTYSHEVLFTVKKYIQGWQK